MAGRKRHRVRLTEPVRIRTETIAPVRVRTTVRTNKVVLPKPVRIRTTVVVKPKAKKRSR